MLSIIKWTLKEMARKKIFLITIVLSIAFLLLYSLGIREISKSFKEMSQQGTVILAQLSFLMTFGLYFSLMLCAFLVIFTSSGIISSEIENYNIYTVLVRPIKRIEYILGRYFGAFIVVYIYSLLIFASIYFINKKYGITIEVPLYKLILSAMLFAFIPNILLTVVLFLSSKLSTMATGVVAVLLYGLAMVGGIIEQIGYAIKHAVNVSDTLQTIGIVSSLILPTDSMYRLTTNMIMSNQLLNINVDIFPSSNPPSIAMLVYTFFYVVAVIFFTVRGFNKKDIK